MQSKPKFSRISCAGLSMLALAGVLASDAMAMDMPKRKAGLWEIRSQVDGMPGGPPIQMCVDQASDNLMRQRGNEKQDCNNIEIKPGSGSTTMHAVCRIDNSTVTMDATYTGSFDSGYKNDMRMRYNPPMHGMSETHMVQEAKWLGPCKPGQKPGDVIMPNMGSVNMNEMMKDPRVQEMMKRRQTQGQ